MNLSSSEYYTVVVIRVKKKNPIKTVPHCVCASKTTLCQTLEPFLFCYCCGAGASGNATRLRMRRQLATTHRIDSPGIFPYCVNRTKLASPSSSPSSVARFYCVSGVCDECTRTRIRRGSEPHQTTHSICRSTSAVALYRRNNIIIDIDLERNVRIVCIEW